MKRFLVLVVMFALIGLGCSRDRAGESSAASPTPITVSLPSATPCVPDDGDNAPCPGTPAPVIHQPLPPLGPIADSDVDAHLPRTLSKQDRRLLRKVMLAWPPSYRKGVRWIFCAGKIVIFIDKPDSVPGYTAAQVVNDHPRPPDEGGEYVNIHNCVRFPMPGA